MQRLIDQTKRLAPQTKILVISPITLGEKVWQEGYDPEFSRESVEVSKGLAAEYEKMMSFVNTFSSFLPANGVVTFLEDENDQQKFSFQLRNDIDKII